MQNTPFSNQCFGTKTTFGWMSEIWTQAIKVLSRSWRSLRWFGEIIRTETLVTEQIEPWPDFDYTLAFVFPLTWVTEISLFAADWCVKHWVISTFPPCLCFKVQSLKGFADVRCLLSSLMYYSSPSTKRSDTSVATTSGESNVNFASGRTYKTQSDSTVRCPYSACMNRTGASWWGSASLHHHPTLRPNFQLWMNALYKDHVFQTNRNFGMFRANISVFK
jgi:hypothetical protein